MVRSGRKTLGSRGLAGEEWASDSRSDNGSGAYEEGLAADAAAMVGRIFASV